MSEKVAEKLSEIGEGSFKDIAKSILNRIVSDQNLPEYIFPSCLSAKNRAYIHRLAHSLYNGQIVTRSSGRGANRCLHVLRKTSSTTSAAVSTYFDVNISPASLQHMQVILTRSPLTAKERAECSTALDKFVAAEMAGDFVRSASGQLSNGLAQVPPAMPSQLPTERQQGLSLPIQRYRQQIIDAVERNQVIIITGEPGCGKTTQVPQMILDRCNETSKPCRIVCTQPRRVAAVSVAARVSAERGEKIGNTVGYQIRLESRVSPKTVLTFCTTGVFLRTIMSGTETVGKTVTHIFIDEVHERDRYCDFLLIAVREMLSRFPGVRVVLMSATIQAELFSNYFSTCPIITVPGRLFEVTEFYLEDILEKTTHLAMLRSTSTVNTQMMAMLYGFDNNGGGDEGSQIVQHIQHQATATDAAEMDHLLYLAFINPVDEQAMKSLVELIIDQRIDVNYRHLETGITALMIAAQRGQLSIVKNLVNDLGADCSLTANYGWTAHDIAQHFGQVAVAQFLAERLKANAYSSSEPPSEHVLVAEYHRLFEGYNPTKPKSMDHRLVFTVIKLVHQTAAIEGAILVFVPGYEDISLLRQMLLSDQELVRGSPRIQLFTLHSQMQSSEQFRVFRRPPPNTRKVVLSTNIAETGITVDDIVFVIDTGLVKEKSFDATVGAHALELRWLSRASASQRKGRAGRCQSGVCYRLYSRRQYAMMSENDTPEILRTPLHELCLQAKLLAPSYDGSIIGFLSRAPDPVPAEQTAAAVRLLKQIEALDCFEELTEFGHHIVDLAIPPQLAKMVLYALVLKCLDPVLTIACILAYKDPFVLPPGLEQRQAHSLSRQRFESGVFSDHMAQLRAFQAWQDAKVDGWEQGFCEKNFLSQGTMDMVVGMRSQLLGQLRASGFVRARGVSDIRDLNSNSENWAVIKAALAAGLYPNVAYVDRTKKRIMTEKHRRCRFHVSSTFRVTGEAANIERIPTEFLIYDELSQTGGITQLRGCTAITATTLLLACGPSRLADLGAELPDVASSDIEGSAEDTTPIVPPIAVKLPPGAVGDDTPENSGQAPPFDHRFRIDDFLKFRIAPQAGSLVRQMRAKFQALVLRRIRSPGKQLSPSDDALLQKVVAILSADEQLLGIPPPPGIGKRPRPIANEAVLSALDDATADIGNAISDEVDQQQSQPCIPGSNSTTASLQFDSFCSSLPVTSSQSLPAAYSPSDAILQSPTTGGGPVTVTKVFSPPRVGASRGMFVFVVSCLRKLSDFHEARRLEVWSASGPEQAGRFAKILAQSGTIYILFTVDSAGGFNGYARLMAHIPGTYSFRLQWIRTCLLPQQLIAARLSGPQFMFLQNGEALSNSGECDSYELPPTVGHTLLRLWSQQVASNGNNNALTTATIDAAELLQRLVNHQQTSANANHF